MREKDIIWLCVVWLVLAFAFPSGLCSGWTPIAPPTDYYAAKAAADCHSDDCDPTTYQKTFLRDADGGQGAETQVKSTLLNPSAPFNQEKSFHQSSNKLDLEVFKPTEVTFFPSGDGNTHREVHRQSPTSFFTYKTFLGPAKPAKTIYYGDLELANLKPATDLKYYKPYKHAPKADLKTIYPANYFDNEVSFHHPAKDFHDHCSLYKVSLRQDLYYQYVQYKVHMPELKEFTLCLWARFHNHSHDHSLFSYGAKHHRQAVYMWVSNLNEPGLFNMKVLGQTIYRLNYPIKLYKWYHTCQSWNGNTGEWQVWVDSHRIARGFHNLLVNHPIPGGGIAISGQEHRHFGRGFQEIPQYFKGSGGLQGEITMLQMYKIALTAGKAYNDHSHHHSHYTTTTTEPPELPTDEPSTTTEHPLLENGQLKKHVNVLELAEALKKGHLDTPEHSPSYHHFFNEPSLSHSYITHVAPVPVHGNAINFLGLPGHAIFKRNDESEATSNDDDDDDDARDVHVKETRVRDERVKVISNVSDQVQVERIRFGARKPDSGSGEDPTVATKSEETAADDSEEKEEEKEEEEEKGKRVGKRLRRQSVVRVGSNRTKRISFGMKRRMSLRRAAEWQEASKRHVILEPPYLRFGQAGLTGPESYSPYGGYPTGPTSYLSHLAGQGFGELVEGGGGGGGEEVEDELSTSVDSGKENREEELAEGEVRRIMALCSGCHVDPFRKVAVISWRSTPKKIYSGTLFLRAKTSCGNF